MSSAAIRFELRRAYADGIGPGFAFSPTVHGSGVVHPIASTAEYERFGRLGFYARIQTRTRNDSSIKGVPIEPKRLP